jgi:hypothetical protein
MLFDFLRISGKALIAALLSVGTVLGAAQANNQVVDLSTNVSFAFQFQELHDADGNSLGYSLLGDPETSLNFEAGFYIPVNASTTQEARLGTLQWSQVSDWDSPALLIGNASGLIDVATSAIPKLIEVVATGKPTPALVEFGPTEKAVNLWLDFEFRGSATEAVSLSVPLKLSFNTTISSGASMILDQSNVVLNDLSVDAESQLFDSVGDIFVKRELTNRGSIRQMGGTVGESLTNQVTATLEVARPLTVHGQLINTGFVNITTGGDLNLLNSTSVGNYGAIAMNGGKLRSSSDFTNFGVIDLNEGELSSGATVVNSGVINWLAGDVYGASEVLNAAAGAFALISAETKRLNAGRSFTNEGTVVQQGDANLVFNSTNSNSAGNTNWSMLTNTAGALYELQGDGGLAAGDAESQQYKFYNYIGYTPTITGGGKGTFNNEGLFRKSGSDGVSTVSGNIAFNNSGTVEVNSGTLEIGAGTSTGATYVVADDARISMRSGFVGANSLTGLGTFEAVDVTGNGDQVSTISGDIGLLDITGSLGASGGGTLTLDVFAGGVARLSGGSIGASGQTINAGAFELVSGKITGSTGLINQSDELRVLGDDAKRIMAGSRFTNEGTVVQQGDANLLFNSTNSHSAGNTNWSMLTNTAGALYELQGDGGLAAGDAESQQYRSYNYIGYTPTITGGGKGTFNNEGLFRKSGSDGVSTVSGNIAFNNSGTVEVNSGTLEIGAGTSTGATYVVADDARISMRSGFVGANSLTGLGTFEAVDVTGNGDQVSTISGDIGLLDITGSLGASGGGTLTLDVFAGGVARLSGGSIGASGQTINAGAFELVSGKITGSTGLINQSDELRVLGDDAKRIMAGSRFTNEGTVVQQGDANLLFNSTNSHSAGNTNWSMLTNTAGALYELQGDGGLAAGDAESQQYRSYNYIGYTPTITGGGKGTFNNEGLFRKSGSDGVSTVSGNIAFNNSGIVDVASGTLRVDGAFATDGGVLVRENAEFARYGSYVQTDGFTRVDGELSATGLVDLQGGALYGRGTVAGDLRNSGNVGPGNSPGILTVDGNYEQSALGILTVELSGGQPGLGFDLLNITGDAYLDGTLMIGLLDSFLPSLDQIFEIITLSDSSKSIFGTFSSVEVFDPSSALFDIHYETNSVWLQVIKVRDVGIPSSLLLILTFVPFWLPRYVRLVAGSTL